MGEVVILDVETRLPIPPERVLNAALENEISSIVLVGIDKEGELYVATSEAGYAEVVFLLERAKNFCMRQIDA